jgi:hypothetical protein
MRLRGPCAPQTMLPLPMPPPGIKSPAEAGENHVREESNLIHFVLALRYRSNEKERLPCTDLFLVQTPRIGAAHCACRTRSPSLNANAGGQGRSRRLAHLFTAQKEGDPKASRREAEDQQQRLKQSTKLNLSPGPSGAHVRMRLWAAVGWFGSVPTLRGLLDAANRRMIGVREPANGKSAKVRIWGIRRKTSSSEVTMLHQTSVPGEPGLPMGTNRWSRRSSRRPMVTSGLSSSRGTRRPSGGAGSASSSGSRSSHRRRDRWQIAVSYRRGTKPTSS